MFAYRSLWQNVLMWAVLCRASRVVPCCTVWACFAVLCRVVLCEPCCAVLYCVSVFCRVVLCEPCCPVWANIAVFPTETPRRRAENYGCHLIMSDAHIMKYVIVIIMWSGHELWPDSQAIKALFSLTRYCRTHIDKCSCPNEARCSWNWLFCFICLFHLG